MAEPMELMVLDPKSALPGTGRRRRLKAALRDPLIVLSSLWLLLVLVAIAFRDLLVPAGSGDSQLRTRLVAPFSSKNGEFFIFGTDALGRDYLVQLIEGTRATVLPAVLAAIIGLLIGVVVGALAGYFGGKVDALVLRVIEFQLAFPSLLLALLILASFGPSTIVVVIVLSLGAWPGLARISRGFALELRSLSFVEAGRAIGGSKFRVIRRHIVPNLLTPVLVLGTLEVAALMLSAAGLDFLGVGIQPPQTSWGQLVSKGRETITTAWWLVLIPGLAIFLTTLSVNLVAVGLRAVFDPSAAPSKHARKRAWTDQDNIDTAEAVAARPDSGVEDATNITDPLSRPAPPMLSAPVDTAALLRVRGLTVDFHTADSPVRALRGVSLSVARGEVVAVVGESGSGKSVLARTIMGILEPTGQVRKGTVEFQGQDILRLPRREARSLYGRRISMIQQNAFAALNPSATVGAQIAEVIVEHNPQVSAEEARRRAIELLAQVGIPEPQSRVDEYPHQFSGGMCQRVVIAMAVANNPELVIADEPTTALDVTVQAQILDLLLTLRRERGMSIILITHDLAVVAECADRVVVMYGGRVMERGSADQVVRASAHPYTARLLAATPDIAAPGARLVAIPGTQPSLKRMPSGCPFHPRCPLAVPKCAEIRPPFIEVGEGHVSACLFADKLASREVTA
jgi:peptide/nickel transport system permease protein